MKHPKPPNYRKALEAISKYEKVVELTAEQTDKIKEIVRRLRRLELRAAELVEINNQLFDLKVPKMSFDPETETLIVQIAGQVVIREKLKRAKPDIPIQVHGIGSVGAYVAGSEESDKVDVETLKELMEDLLELYYNSAFRILRLAKTLPQLTKLECAEITIVRNKLIEHPAQGDLYSFGFSTEGPQVKPIIRGKREWRDKGLVPNTKAFDKALSTALNKAAN